VIPRVTGQLYSFKKESLRPASRALNAVTETIAEALKKGESVPLIGFGIFEVRDRSARTGRNPRTGEELKIKEAKVPARQARPLSQR
jgi:DNA-binding protein HU-beta